MRFLAAHYLKTSLWVVPLLFILGGIVLSLLATEVGGSDLIPQSITGDPAAARQILYLISFAMLTLTGLVLSLVVVAVQLAMGTFSPRIVRQILQDRPSQCAIGLFAGTFTFSLLALRSVRTTQDGGEVPGVAVVTAIVLVILCVMTVVWYLNHIAQSLRTAALVEWVAQDTVTALDRLYRDGEAPALAHEFIPAQRSGVIFMIKHSRLVALAERADCQLELLWGLGDFVPNGSPLVRVVGKAERVPRSKIVRAIAIGPERTLNQDVAYGIRMLVDIAERSISSGPFADPTTTVQAIDRIHDIVRQAAWRSLPSGRYFDAAGTLRLTVPTLQWDALMRLSFEELRQAGAGSPQVARRLTAALDDLIDFAPADRRPALERQRDLLHAQAVRSALSPADGAAALEPDPAGLGAAPADGAAAHRAGGRRATND